MELTFLADKKRVEVLAHQQLKMMMPVRDKIVYLRP
ncbi:MAG TPA: cell division protein FtsL [Methylomicrobium sp.]|nr:cell division protein FtsL [Methylomicrobium sp.]